MKSTEGALGGGVLVTNREPGYGGRIGAAGGDAGGRGLAVIWLTIWDVACSIRLILGPRFFISETSARRKSGPQCEM